MSQKLIVDLKNRVISGESISFSEAELLADLSEEMLPELVNAAGEIRECYHGSNADLCSIISARSGRCAEDCRFCAQSTHYSCNVSTHPMISSEAILDGAKRAEAGGAHHYCIVTSGDRLSKKDFRTVLRAIVAIKKETGLKRCVSLGRLSRQEVEELATAGLNRCHHNLETARSFYPKICSTHNYEDRLWTIENLKSAGIELCVGGILNLGESDRQRLEFAFEIAATEPDSVPINFLNPRPGTPLAGRPPMETWEAIKTIAIFRFILPKQIIRLAAGRCEALGRDQRLGIEAGINGLLIGDYLTTSGSEINKDLEMLDDLGFDLSPS